MCDIEVRAKEAQDSFIKITKRILQNRPLTTNEDKLTEYKTLLIESYNSIISLNIECLSNDNTKPINDIIVRCREQLKKCFVKLQCTIQIPQDFTSFLQEGVIKDYESDDEFLYNTLQVSGENIKRHSSLSALDNLINFDNNYYTTNAISENLIMATVGEKKSFVTMCASIIRDNYSGDPLALESFIDKIDLIESLAEENLIPTLIAFLKSKLEGKAREALPTTISCTNDIKSSLRARIKPDNSKVVAGKIASLHVANNNYSDFSKRVEELAEALERSLIIEGITQTKAHEMAVEQTVNVCRINAKSSLVKSILASTEFKDPKDVVATLIVEQNNEVQERQVLAFRARTSNNFRSYRGNNRGSYGHNFSRGHNSSRGYRQNNNRSTNFTNSNGRQSQRLPSNRNNNSHNNMSRNTNNGRQSNVRTLNAQAPQERTLGDSSE